MPAGVCGACHHMCDEKQSVECIGPCAAYYHLSCAKIDTSEREFFIVDGVSVYKCHNCTRRGNNDVCVTPIASCQKVKATEISLLPGQNKCIENNFECLVVDKLNILKENGDSMLHHLKEIVNKMEKISADLNVLRTENEMVKCILTECLKQNEACSFMKPNNPLLLSKFIKSSSKSGTDNCTGDPLAAEDINFKIVHKRIKTQRAELSSPISTSAQKIEACFNSGVSTSAIKPKMKALPEVKADEVK